MRVGKGGARQPPFTKFTNFTKCTLQLSGQIHSPYFISTLPIYVLCAWFVVQTFFLTCVSFYCMCKKYTAFKGCVLWENEGDRKGVKSPANAVAMSRWIGNMRQTSHCISLHNNEPTPSVLRTIPHQCINFANQKKSLKSYYCHAVFLGYFPSSFVADTGDKPIY